MHDQLVMLERAMGANTADRLYDAVASFRDNKPLDYECMVRDGIQNYNRLAVHADECLDPYLVGGALIYTEEELHRAGGQMLTHILRIMDGDLARVPRLIENGRDVQTLVESQFRPGVRSRIDHGIQARRYTFRCVWPEGEEDERRHICSNHHESQRLGYRVLADWKNIVECADSTLVQRFENPPVNGMSREEQKKEFARAAEAFTLMGNCVDFDYQSAVDEALTYFEDVQSMDLGTLADV